MRSAHKVESCSRFRVCCFAQELDEFSHGGTEARRESQGSVCSSSSGIQRCVLAQWLRASVREHAAREIPKCIAGLMPREKIV